MPSSADLLFHRCRLLLWHLMERTCDGTALFLLALALLSYCPEQGLCMEHAHNPGASFSRQQSTSSSAQSTKQRQQAKAENSSLALEAVRKALANVQSTDIQAVASALGL